MGVQLDRSASFDFIFIEKRAIQVSVRHVVAERTTETDFVEVENDIIVPSVGERYLSPIGMGRSFRGT